MSKKSIDGLSNVNASNITTGTLSITANPIFLYTASTSISVTNSTDTNFTDWDTPILSSGITTNGTKIIVPTAGRYFVNVQMPFNLNNTGYRYSFIYINSTNPGTLNRPISSLMQATSNNTVSVHLNMSGILNLNAGDFFVVGVNQNSGGPLAVGSINTVFVARISVYFLNG